MTKLSLIPPNLFQSDSCINHDGNSGWRDLLLNTRWEHALNRCLERLKDSATEAHTLFENPSVSLPVSSCCLPAFCSR